MKKPSQKDIAKILNTQLDPEKEGVMYLHCDSCLKKFKEEREEFSPEELTSYQATAYPFELPNGSKIGIIVVWCKNCGKRVWDSRHLQPWL